MSEERYFSRGLFAFLRDLSANNDRPWFMANKARYERHVKAASQRFIEDFQMPLHGISSYLVADPSTVGGSLFRIYRDTRFSKDKRPYKTHVGIRFQHQEAKNVHAPGYYLHISLDGIWMGAGIWRPGSPALGKIRGAIMENPAAWKRTKNAKRFRETFALTGDVLKRAPRGTDPDHPLIEDLRRTDFIGTSPLSRKILLGTDLMGEFTSRCRAAAPFNRFLCGALGLRY